jgi:hypothetical protein
LVFQCEALRSTDYFIPNIVEEENKWGFVREVLDCIERAMGGKGRTSLCQKAARLRPLVALVLMV